ncbi:hypothetical protein [Paenibacillus doosanensis]|uniref:hypothetical protein n=1 Tax=Paenibacillus doosanensis TaxID=1229154 RepID=UPI00217F4920|nr:hypothetical protein [Paenibacillus doosanensis]
MRKDEGFPAAGSDSNVSAEHDDQHMGIRRAFDGCGGAAGFDSFENGNDGDKLLKIHGS